MLVKTWGERDLAMVTQSTDRTLVDPSWLAERQGDAGIRLIHVDAIGTEAYDREHIPGALGWNWKEWLWDPITRDFPKPETFAYRCGECGIANDTTVVFYGEPPQFGTYAWWVFKYMNHKDVRILDGGLSRWKVEGRPRSAERQTFQPTTYVAPKNVSQHMRASRDDVLANLNKFKDGAESVLLDHRSPEEFSGELVNGPGMPNVGAERSGRIPGARHLYFAEFLNADTSFKSSEEMQRLLAMRGATPDKKIISYCRLSHRATLAYFVMTELLGYEKVKSYDGSWTEWGSMVGLPIER